MNSNQWIHYAWNRKQTETLLLIPCTVSSGIFYTEQSNLLILIWITDSS